MQTLDDFWKWIFEVRHTKASKVVSDLKDSEARLADLAQSEHSSLNKTKLVLDSETDFIKKFVLYIVN